MNENTSTRWYAKLSHWLLFGLAISLIIIAIFFGVFRALTPWATSYQPEIEKRLTEITGQPVHIQSMETSWYWFEPVIKLNQIMINHQAISIHKLLIGIDLWRTLWHWQLEPGMLYIDGVKLQVFQTDSGWRIEGLLPSNKESVNPTLQKELLAWTLSQHKIILRNISGQVTLKNGVRIPLQSLNVTSFQRGGSYHFKGEASLKQNLKTHVRIIGNVKFSIKAVKELNGQLYIALDNLSLPQWQKLFPPLPILFKKGTSHFEFWFTFAKGHLTGLDSQVNFDQTFLQDAQSTQTLLIPTFDAHLLWERNTQGWQFKSDNLQLTLDDKKWPINALQIDYNEPKALYQIYVKHILINSLQQLYTKLIAFKSLKPILENKKPIHWMSINPTGSLDNTQFSLQKKEEGYTLSYLLTKFTDLGIKQSHRFPGIKHLAGVIEWEPEEGRLDLDSEQVIVEVEKQKPKLIELFNARLDWKTLSHGLRVSLDHLTLERPDLIISAAGAIDEPLSPSANLRLTLEFYGKNFQQWFVYLPLEIKPKLMRWLKEEVKEISKVSGQLTLAGPLDQFPFENNTGVFALETRLTGVDLYFHPNWPLVRDIDGTLNIKGRNLEANIYHAQLNNVPLKGANLRVNDMGLNHEAILLNGKFHAYGEDLLNYVNQSPLKQKLSGLSVLTIKQPLDLNLRLEVPLAEVRPVLVEGDVTFKDNVVVVAAMKSTLQFNDANGKLSFNESGIVEGRITATLWEKPMIILLSALTQKTPITLITLLGQVSIESLKTHFQWPIWSVMKGELGLMAQLRLFNEGNRLNILKLATNLKGTTIDLPPPLNKAKETIAPLQLNIGFSATQLNVWLKYKEMALFARQLHPNDWYLKLNEPAIGASLRYQSMTDTLSGTLERLYIDPKLINHDSEKSHSLAPKEIPNLNLAINELKWGDLNLGKLTLKSQSTDQNWTLESATLSTPSYQMNIKGDWLQKPSNNRTQFQGNMKINNLANLLEQWGITPVVLANKGNVSFKGGWKGGVTDFSLSKVQGILEMVIKDGRITDLSPETEEKLGLGKLLSILSLQTIPRRLKLDFSDLSEKGYSFDVFEGHFRLKNGVMTTNDSYIDGPVAYAKMQGDLDLVKQLYDLDLHVSPHITASLPVVATIAGGPIAGIAAWVASKIINKGMQAISGYSYKISGSWKDPVVQQLKIVKKKNIEQQETSH